MKALRYGFVFLVGLFFFHFSQPASAVIRVDNICYDTWDGVSLSHTCIRFSYDDGTPSPHEGREIGGGGGSGGTAPNQGDTPSNKRDANQKTDCDSAGNPVIFSTGNKIEPETDFTSVGEMPLSLTRTYNYYWDGIGIFGRRWLSDYDYKLLFTTDDPTSTCYPRPENGYCDPTGKPIWAQRADGRKIKFNYQTSPAVGWYEDKPSPIAKILKSGTNYVLYSEDHSVETYDSYGFPITINNRQGIGWTFQYTGSHYLTRVTHSSGRHVDFTWSSDGLLTKVTDPAGNAYNYGYKTLSVTTSTLASADASSTMYAPMLICVECNLDDPPPAPANPPVQTMVALLTSTTQPGTASTAITYHYEDSRFPTALTGKTINGLRYSWFSYDVNGRAIESKHANGVERYGIAYTLNSAGDVVGATVTNPQGKDTAYTFTAKGDIATVTGKASLHCSQTDAQRIYDANGYLEGATDFNGNVTAYEHDAKGQPLSISKIDKDGHVLRETTYVWDGENRITKETLAGDHEITSTYGSDGRLANVTVKNLSAIVSASQGQTRTTTYSYTTWSNGLLQTVIVDGPLSGSGDAVTYSYAQTGDLLNVKNGLGQATTYSGYNGLGLPSSITGPNGDRHTYIYDARGRVIDDQTNRNGGTQHTTYEYDGFGRLSRVTQPDGHTHSYQYDGAGRRVSEYEPEAGGTFAQTVYTYNAMSLPTSVKKQRAFVEPARGTVP
jgi:YD repeat-containing protein